MNRELLLNKGPHRSSHQQPHSAAAKVSRAQGPTNLCHPEHGRRVPCAETMCSCCTSGADCTAEGAEGADAGLQRNLLSVLALAFPVCVAVQARQQGWNGTSGCREVALWLLH